MKSRAAAIALLAYVVALGLLVLWPTHPEAFLTPQLTALTTSFAAHPSTAWITYGVLNGVANVVLFVPLTLLAVLVFGRGWWFLIFAAGAAASAGAELFQATFLPGRTPDVSDIVAGGIGALLGVAIGVLASRSGSKRRATDQSVTEHKEEASSPDGTGE